MPSLIVNGRNAEARLESRHIVVKRHNEENPSPPRYVPLHDIDRVTLIGQPHVSVPTLCEFMRRGIPVAFLSSRGRWMGALCPDNNLNSSRRIMQYEISRDPDFATPIARALIRAKIHNSRRVLQRLAANRSQTDDPDHIACMKELDQLGDKVDQEDFIDAMRGYEGLAGARYFNRLRVFFPEEMPFTERSRRPPRDPANALLSWTYTVVLGELDARARAHGLDTGIGFLHQLAHGRPSLSLDLLEPFRPALCDLLVMNIVNHRQLTTGDFECDPETGGWLLKQAARKKYFTAYESAMSRKFTLRKGEPHTDYRRELEQAVLTIIRAIENGSSEIDFFTMP